MKIAVESELADVAIICSGSAARKLSARRDPAASAT
jgi:ribosomal silencing factor RsfS